MKKLKGATFGSVLGQLLPAALLAGLFALVGVVHVSARVMVVDAGYRLSRLEDEGRTLAREKDRLEVELATLRNPARLEKVALELGMGPPPAASVWTARPLKLARAKATP